MPRKDDTHRDDTALVKELELQNLCYVQTKGYGNCLFHAFSDQLYGDQSQHALYRAGTLNYMRTNSADFKTFLPNHPGGGQRRNPKRKNRGALGLDTNEVARDITPQEVDHNFQRYLESMNRPGAYAGHLEINAFANAYNVNVKIYSEEAKRFVDTQCPKVTKKDMKTVMIVHHTWDHYSSIREISGPRTSLPNIPRVNHPAKLKVTGEFISKPSFAPSWVVDSIQRALPYLATREEITEALIAYKGNTANAVSALMPASSESSSRSSSIERDLDSDDELDFKPNKKNRPSHLQIGKSNKNFKYNAEDPKSISPDPSQLSSALSKLTGNDVRDPDETEEEDWQNQSVPNDPKSTPKMDSASPSSVASAVAARHPQVRLSLPKKPLQQIQSSSGSSETSSNAGYDADGEKPHNNRVFAKAKGRLNTGAKQTKTIIHAKKLGEKEQPKSTMAAEKYHEGKHDIGGEERKSPQSPPTVIKPRRRLITGAERDRLNAEKARKALRRPSLSPTSANSKSSSHTPPVIGEEIKVLSL